MQNKVTYLHDIIQDIMQHACNCLALHEAIKIFGFIVNAQLPHAPLFSFKTRKPYEYNSYWIIKRQICLGLTRLRNNTLTDKQVLCHVVWLDFLFVLASRSKF